jgi:hypothetical protein
MCEESFPVKVMAFLGEELAFELRSLNFLSKSDLIYSISYDLESCNLSISPLIISISFS